MTDGWKLTDLLGKRCFLMSNRHIERETNVLTDRSRWSKARQSFDSDTASLNCQPKVAYMGCQTTNMFVEGRWQNGLTVCKTKQTLTTKFLTKSPTQTLMQHVYLIVTLLSGRHPRTPKIELKSSRCFADDEKF